MAIAMRTAFLPQGLRHQGAQAGADVIGGVAVGDENEDGWQGPLGHDCRIKLFSDQSQSLAHVGDAVSLQVFPAEMLDLLRRGDVPNWRRWKTL